MVALGLLTAAMTNDVGAASTVWFPLALVVATTAGMECRGRRVPALWVLDLAAVLVVRVVADVEAGGEPVFALLAAPILAGLLGGPVAVPTTVVGIVVSIGMRPMGEAESGETSVVVAAVVLGSLAAVGAAIAHLSHTQRDRMREATAQSDRLQAVLSAMLRSDPRGVVVRDGCGRLAEVNPVAARILGLGAEDIGRTLPGPSIFSGPLVDRHGEPLGQLPAPDERALLGGEVVTEEVIGLGQDCRWVSVDSIPVDAVDGRWVVTQFRDVTEETSTLSRLQREAGVDPLTGAGNRRLLDWTLKELDRRDDHVVAVVVDLDGFKQVNDLHGHGVGDEILRELALRLVAASRPDDVVIRTGGDEFLLLLRGGEEGDTARIIDRLRAALNAPFPTESGLLDIGVSLGFQDGTAMAARSLIRVADGNMYQDKRRHRPGADVRAAVVPRRSQARQQASSAPPRG